MTILITASQRAKIFKLLDTYSRTHHQCFLTEMFLDESHTKYVLCFRPLGAKIDSPNRYACSYVRIGLDDVENADALDESLAGLLDKELTQLTSKLS